MEQKQTNMTMSASFAAPASRRMLPGTPPAPPTAGRVEASAVRSVRDAGALRLVTQGILIVLATALFAAFCVAASIGMWYLVGTFANNSYKAVSAFLVFILISNVASKYLAWCMEKLNT